MFRVITNEDKCEFLKISITNYEKIFKVNFSLDNHLIFIIYLINIILKTIFLNKIKKRNLNIYDYKLFTVIIINFIKFINLSKFFQKIQF